MKAFLIFFLLLFGSFVVASSSDASREWLGDWLALNNPKVKKYLTSLLPSFKGKAIKGLTLTDGEIILDKAVYEDSFVNPQTGLHLYIFRTGSKKKVYAWVDKNGKEVLLPECAVGSEFEHEGSRVLSGDIYTWKALQPGDDVVIILCPTEEWFQSVK